MVSPLLQLKVPHIRLLLLLCLLLVGGQIQAQHHNHQSDRHKGLKTGKKGQTTKPSAKVPNCITRGALLPKGWDTNNLLEVRMSTQPGMQFSQNMLELPAGANVRWIFSNQDDMSHNCIIVPLNSLEEVVTKAAGLGASSFIKGYVPEHNAIMANTCILNPEESDTIYFEVPSAGSLAYVCTLPGHAKSMRGTITVKPAN